MTGDSVARPAPQNSAMNVLRAAVAVLVVMTHVRALMFDDYADAPHSAVSAVLYALTALGHPAVMIFFVLSGCWVGDGVRRRVLAGTFSWRTYAVQRLTRLWIVLLPVLLISAVIDRVGRALYPDSTIYRAGVGTYAGGITGDLDHHLSGLTLLANTLFIQGLRAPTYGTNSPLWSLGFEFWFYVLFPLLLIALAKSRSSLLTRLVAFAAAAGVIVLIGSVHGLVYFAVWCLGVGLALSPKVHAFRGRATVTLAALALLLVVMVPDRTASVPADFIVGVVAAGVVWLMRVDFAVDNAVWRGAAYFGEWASYSLYLVHLPLLALLTAATVPDVGRRVTLGVESILAAVGAVALMVVAALVLSALTERRTPRVRQWVTAGIVRVRRRSPVASDDRA